jgi:hypothetical protein
MFFHGAGKTLLSSSLDVTDIASGDEDEDEDEDAGEVAKFVVDRAGTPGYASAGGAAQEVRDRISKCMQ